MLTAGVKALSFIDFSKHFSRSEAFLLKFSALSVRAVLSIEAKEQQSLSDLFEIWLQLNNPVDPSLN